MRVRLGRMRNISILLWTSADVIRNHIISLSFVPQLVSFYVETEAYGADTQSAGYLAAWYKSMVVNVLGPKQWC
jgi:hypothetical protein